MPRAPTLGLCGLAVWGMMLSCSSAEREYFSVSTTKASWVDARSHCQHCFSQLVTLTPENIQNITRNLSSEHWIGLRKRPLKATDNSTLYPFNDNTTFWSRWANGDPLSFQNWYPGYPVFKSPFPRKHCCSCSCTCPAMTPVAATTNSIPSVSASYSTAFSQCEKTQMLFAEPDPDENYIEDSCVAMLSFGAWVEKECSELLPFICYEDRFYGEVNVTGIKSTSAKISWDQGPGDITHYRVEVNGSVRINNHSELTYHLSGLETGTFYSVQVFPVKCGRDLNPENGTFYTVPNKVTGLQVVDQTEECVSLKWTRPIGNVDLYIIKTKDHEVKSVTEKTTICDLTAGSLHTFSVSAGVSDQSQHSEESTIDAYTRPAQVSNVTTKVGNTSLTLSWDKPQGSATGYRVATSWKEISKTTVSYTNETEENGEKNTLTLMDLPSGTKMTLNIAALANNTLEGESLIVVCFTEPEDITDLQLKSTEHTITAEWKVSKGSPHFKVQLRLGEDETNTTNTSGTHVMFPGLFSAAKYTVTVYTVTENSEKSSSGFNRSIFTLPTPPRNAELSSASKSHLTFTWMPPFETETVQYLVILSSSFWGQEWRKILNNQTTYTFDSLKSGTNYSFSVQTTAGEKESEALLVRAATDSDKREITLSMVCSSSRSLFCDEEKTRNHAFQEMYSHFHGLLGDHVVWKLERVDRVDT